MIPERPKLTPAPHSQSNADLLLIPGFPHE